jgi:hypothetical protein
MWVDGQNVKVAYQYIWTINICCLKEKYICFLAQFPCFFQSPFSWEITLPSPLIVNLRFGGTSRLYLQGRSATASCWFLAWRILQPWRLRRHVTPQCRLTFNGLHGVISQKILLFITIAERASNAFLCLPCKKWIKERTRVSRMSVRVTVSLPECFNSGTAGRIFMTFYMKFTPFAGTQNSYLWLPTISDKNMADARY